MTGLVRKATLFAACGLMIAGVAMASVPDPSHCSKPNCVSLVGNAAGVTDVAGNFTIVVRDINNLPINNSLVVVDFSACSGVNLCSAQSAGLTTDCPTQTVRGFTNGVGSITLAIAGHGNNSLGNQPPFNPANCGKIYADGVLIGNVNVSMFDQDGGGVSGADLSAFLGDFFGSQPLRSDYDCTNTVTGADLSALLGVFFASGSASNCPTSSTQCSMVP